MKGFVALSLLQACCLLPLAPFVAQAQQVTSPPGYFDIPTGFDFPADRAALERYRASGDLSAQRLHAWHVFEGLTHPTPDGKLPVFETWYSEDETFQSGPALEAVAPRRAVHRFRQPNQFRTPPGQIEAQAAGTALLSEVLYNFPAYRHIRDNQLYRTSKLEALLHSGDPDRTIPGNRTIPPFPPEAVSLKTVWWPVARDKITPMPIWDPESNPARPTGNDYTTWARAVAVDPNGANLPADATTTVSFAGKVFPDAHRVGIDAFYSVRLDQQTAASAMEDPGVANASQIALGRGLEAGDLVVFAGTHVTTKEIDDWVWATFWWHDRPDAGPFAADRPQSLGAPWRNYLMSVSYDVILPREADSSPHVAFNPWLEARFRNGGNGGGVVSNCMNCHARASYPNVSFLPVYRGAPDVGHDSAFNPNRLRADFLWSVPDQAQ